MTVVIIDYGSGNLRSAAKAFERAADDNGLGLDVIVSDKPGDLGRASHIVLPGVGAFGDCRAGLGALDGMVDALGEAVISGATPFLGICVGMQLMATRGLEHGETPGFGWIEGEVRAIQPSDKTIKIPHMGWNTVRVLPGNPLFHSVADESYFYFVHSYYVVPQDPTIVATTTFYGTDFTSGVQHENIHAFQFHPEKSQRLGLTILKNFSNLH